MSDNYVPVSGCFPDTTGFWRLPLVSDMVDKMRYAYEHRLECEEKATAAAAYTKRNLTWIHGAKRALMQIEDMLGSDNEL